MNWLYATKDDQQIGPVDESTIRALIKGGIIIPATLVWSDGMTDWEPASRTELAVHFPKHLHPPANTPPLHKKTIASTSENADDKATALPEAPPLNKDPITELVDWVFEIPDTPETSKSNDDKTATPPPLHKKAVDSILADNQKAADLPEATSKPPPLHKKAADSTSADDKKVDELHKATPRPPPLNKSDKADNIKPPPLNKVAVKQGVANAPKSSPLKSLIIAAFILIVCGVAVWMMMGKWAMEKQIVGRWEESGRYNASYEFFPDHAFMYCRGKQQIGGRWVKVGENRVRVDCTGSGTTIAFTFDDIKISGDVINWNYNGRACTLTRKQ